MALVRCVDQTFWCILCIYLVLLFGVTIVMIYLVVKYRRSPKTMGSDSHDNYQLEIVWTVIPTIIALSLFYLGCSSYLGL